MTPQRILWASLIAGAFVAGVLRGLDAPHLYAALVGVIVASALGAVWTLIGGRNG